MGLELDDHDSNNSGGLQLILGLALSHDHHRQTPTKPYSSSSSFITETSLTLGLSTEISNNYPTPQRKNYEEEEEDVLVDLSTTQTPSPLHSGVSSFSIKRERDVSSDEVIERVSSRVLSCDNEDEDGSNSTPAARKKLRLTKEQSAMLEESFKTHTTLNPKQKQALARQLNLRARQVEVWFQNRRARTKLKQTEVDCEFLKKCCESLTDENRRLQKEVQELKALKLEKPLYMPMPAATLTMCPSCERLGSNLTVTAATASNKTPFSMPPNKTHHFYNPFANPSAAC